jgi:hypothetical protein
MTIAGPASGSSPPRQTPPCDGWPSPQRAAAAGRSPGRPSCCRPGWRCARSTCRASSGRSARSRLPGRGRPAGARASPLGGLGLPDPLRTADPSANRRTTAQEDLVECLTHDLYLLPDVGRANTLAGLARHAHEAVSNGLAHRLEDWYVHENVWPGYAPHDRTPHLYLIVNKPWNNDLQLAGAACGRRPGRPGLWIWDRPGGRPGSAFRIRRRKLRTRRHLSRRGRHPRRCSPRGTARPDRQIGALISAASGPGSAQPDRLRSSQAASS